MANYQTLKSGIQDVVKTNGNNEITGSLLQQSLLAMINSLGSGYQFIDVATSETNPGTPDQKVFYIANGKGTYTNFGEISITEDEVVILYYDTAWHKLLTGIASQDKLSELEQVFQNLNGDTLYITDKDGYVIAKIDKNGIESVEVLAQGKKLSEQKELTIESILEDFYTDSLYISDANGNVVAKVDKSGISAADVIYDKKSKNDWYGKTIATYGDSVTALQNGDFAKPYTFDSAPNSWMWGNRVADYYRMKEHHGRGIGGQGYKWQTAAGNGGSITWVGTDGNYIGRLDQFNLDNWDGVTYPSGVTAQMVSNGDAIAVRGSLSSWLRITKMFPSSIKDTIDVVLVMAHNDTFDSSECTFLSDDATDAEWANSGDSYYGKINGDYDLTTLKGGIASSLMKLQLWMPNAIIVLLSGISGQGTAGELNMNINGGLGRTAQAIREMSNLTSIPCIDTFSTNGINGWNRTTYIADSIHPYTVAGSKMFARAVIGGLKSILPNI